MVLLYSEFKRFFEPRPGFGAAIENEQGFAEQNTRHHPVGLLSRAPGQVLDGLGGVALVQERLREAEAKQLVVGLLRDEHGEMRGAGWIVLSHR